MRSQLSVHHEGSLHIGNDVFVNFGTTISASSSISIGDRTLIANLVTIMDHDFHGVEIRDQPDPPQPIIIGRDVWICVKATILKGVTIGDGAVIAAGAVVATNIPPYSLAAGVPARVIRSLPHTNV